MAEITRTVNFADMHKEINRISKQMRFWSVSLRADLMDEMIDGANRIRNIIILSMRDTKKAMYTYNRGGKKHYPSKPGYPPAIDTGELLRSITIDARPLEIEIGATDGAPYAVYLEDGTSKMKKRPWLAPAVDSQTGYITRRILERMEKTIK